MSGGSEMASDMSGKAKGFGSLSAFGYQDYDAMVSVINFGPNFAVSSMGDDFNQGIGGSAHGLAGVHNSVDLSAENSYAQFAVSPGGDWMFQSGESFTNSSLEGGAVLFGNYGGSVGGSQYGVTITNQDPTSQSGIQAASAKLNGGTYDNGLAIANLSAAMGQTHSYEQVNVNSNGYQHQTGTVTTNVSVQSGYPHP
ncbi:hypothetical protein KKG48_00285 [Patescibacteria group bacterium]|nr:hypothetical protein [Patescibacteria group bacterium]